MIEVSGFAAALSDRANSRCELCGSEHALSLLKVPPTSVADMARCVLICEKCSAQLATSEPGDLNHWRCLNEAAWSDVTAVKVLTWRLLKRMEAQALEKDLLDQM